MDPISFLLFLEIPVHKVKSDFCILTNCSEVRWVFKLAGVHKRKKLHQFSCNNRTLKSADSLSSGWSEKKEALGPISF